MTVRSRLLVPVLAVTMAAGMVAATPQHEQGATRYSEASAAQAPAGYTFQHAWYQTHDGVTLHAGVYLPEDRADDEQHPAMVSITPYTSPNGGATGLGFTESEMPIRFPELFAHEQFVEDRWAYVAVDVRGFGGSGGCFSYYSEDEFLDTKATIDWAGTESWSNGEVALWGKSYDAAQMVMALGSGSDHLSAAVIQAPGLSGYTGLWHNGVHYATGRYGTTSIYVADDLFPPASTGSVTEPNYALSYVDGVEKRHECTVDWQAMNVIGDRNDPYWADKEPYLQSAGSDVPSLWHWGFHDANTKPVGFDIYESHVGPKQAWFGQWTHVRGHEPGVGREGFLEEAFRFLDVHVFDRVGANAGDPAVTVQSGGPDGEFRQEAQWPPADMERWELALNLGSYEDLPEAQTGGPEDTGIWTATPELPHDVHIAGEIELTVSANTLTPNTHLVARVYDLDTGAAGPLIARGAIALPNAGENSVTFRLYPQDYRVFEGKRIGINLMASEDGWYHPGTSGTTVEITNATMTFPLLTLERSDDVFLDGGASDASVVSPVAADPAVIAAAEVEGAIPPAMR